MKNIWYKHKEAIVGLLMAIVFCTVVGKIWMMPWMSWWEVLWVVVKSQVGMQ